jgi:transposase
MATGRPLPPLELTPEERASLERLVRRGKTAQRLAFRARIVLRCAEGLANMAVAQELGTSNQTVGKWRSRFVERREDGLSDEPRPGAPRTVNDEKVEELVTLTLESTPKGASHWSTRGMAQRTGVSQSSVSRIWRAFGLQPHRSETFKLSTNPYFIEKVRDVVGLYLHPPEGALVLCVDEKSQIQALDRTQPLLPMSLGYPEQRTHDYVRHGTTSLFAALNVASGKVIGRCFRRHRAKEFIRFLDTIDQAVPADQHIHLICDNYATHKTPAVKAWFASRPRYHVHFTPTHSSWLNQVERWFALLSTRAIKRGTHRSTLALQKAIEAYVEASNEDPQPFVWSKSADEIQDSIARYCSRILTTHTDPVIETNF